MVACICGCVCKQGLEIKLLFSVSIKSYIAGHQQLQGILDSPDACVKTGTMGSMLNTGLPHSSSPGAVSDS